MFIFVIRIVRKIKNKIVGVFKKKDKVEDKKE